MLTTTVNITDRFESGREGKTIKIVGIHTSEAPETATEAEAVANYFKTVDASAHWCVDDNSRVRVVLDQDTAWTMPPLNQESLNVEMAGFAGQTPTQWNDAYSQAVLDNTALCVAEWCVKFDIPPRHLSYDQIRNGERGIVGHVDVDAVYRDSDHWDPGPNFPWPVFIALVQKHMTSHPDFHKPNCTALQTTIHAAVDNMWGPSTDDHFSALIDASNFGGSAFPFGVQFTQQVVGTKQDGIWGPASKLAHQKTVVAVQTILGRMGFSTLGVDGVWGPNTDRAYRKARAACHI